MSASSIKSTNHRVYPCPNDKKLSLLKQVILENQDSKIIVISSQEASIIKETLEDATNIQVLNDEALFKDESIKCELLISLDLPQKAILYIKRLSHTTSKAILILNESEQKLLYPIETLLGRAIKQEIVEGFEYEKQKEIRQKPKQKQMSKQDIKDVAKQRYEEGTRDPNEPKKEFKKPEGDKKFDKPRAPRDENKAKQWEKQKKAPNKFLGKDEKGKALFSGKSGERNHRHDGTPRDSYDAPKKVGKKISIKSLKKPEDKKAD